MSSTMELLGPIGRLFAVVMLFWDIEPPADMRQLLEKKIEPFPRNLSAHTFDLWVDADDHQKFPSTIDHESRLADNRSSCSALTSVPAHAADSVSSADDLSPSSCSLSFFPDDDPWTTTSSSPEASSSAASPSESSDDTWSSHLRSSGAASPSASSDTSSSFLSSGVHGALSSPSFSASEDGEPHENDESGGFEYWWFVYKDFKFGKFRKVYGKETVRDQLRRQLHRRLQSLTQTQSSGAPGESQPNPLQSNGITVLDDHDSVELLRGLAEHPSLTLHRQQLGAYCGERHGLEKNEFVLRTPLHFDEDDLRRVLQVHEESFARRVVASSAPPGPVAASEWKKPYAALMLRMVYRRASPRAVVYCGGYSRPTSKRIH